MKEQISVDEISHLQRAIEDNLCSQCVITFDEMRIELQRLKRLDENVKKLIDELKNEDVSDLRLVIMCEVLHETFLVDTLESLYE